MKDQHNFEIVYVKLVENIIVNVNRAWETYALTLVFCKSRLISKNVHFFDDFVECFNNIFHKRIIWFFPKQDSHW